MEKVQLDIDSLLQPEFEYESANVHTEAILNCFLGENEHSSQSVIDQPLEVLMNNSTGKLEFDGTGKKDLLKIAAQVITEPSKVFYVPSSAGVCLPEINSVLTNELEVRVAFWKKLFLDKQVELEALKHYNQTFKKVDLLRSKKKKSVPRFDSDKKKEMLEIFNAGFHFLSKEGYNDLAKKLNLKTSQVKVWFQNRRSKFAKNST